MTITLSALAGSFVLRPRRWLEAVSAALLAAPFILYGAASALVYDRLSRVSAKCPGGDAQEPTSFTIPSLPEFDTTPYHMPEPEIAVFPSRGEPKVSIVGWWEPAPGTAPRPAVILVHGFGACRRNGGMLLAAGMLHRHGFGVLLIDLRDHGDSTVQDGRWSGGTDEYRDVLGAFDWLRSRGVPADAIGVAGFSLGAATALIAAGEEPAIAAVWEDSGYADIDDAINEELERNGFPRFLRIGGLMVARLRAHGNFRSLSPLRATRRLNGRPVYITHGAQDTRVSVHFADDLAAAIREDGGHVEPWIVQGAEHTQALLLQPAEYERRIAAFFGAALRAPRAPSLVDAPTGADEEDGYSLSSSGPSGTSISTRPFSTTTG